MMSGDVFHVLQKQSNETIVLFQSHGDICLAGTEKKRKGKKRKEKKRKTTAQSSKPSSQTTFIQGQR
eukprot:1143856-Pelagomonas_calceolata.AAC.1